MPSVKLHLILFIFLSFIVGHFECRLSLDRGRYISLLNISSPTYLYTCLWYELQCTISAHNMDSHVLCKIRIHCNDDVTHSRSFAITFLQESCKFNIKFVVFPTIVMPVYYISATTCMRHTHTNTASQINECQTCPPTT